MLEKFRKKKVRGKLIIFFLAILCVIALGGVFWISLLFHISSNGNKALVFAISILILIVFVSLAAKFYSVLILRNQDGSKKLETDELDTEIESTIKSYKEVEKVKKSDQNKSKVVDLKSVRVERRARKMELLSTESDVERDSFFNNEEDDAILRALDKFFIYEENDKE